MSDGETSVLFDMGTGSLANMREHLDYDVIDHVVVSHMHADHFFDLIPLRYALQYGPRKRESRVQVWLPPGGEEQLKKISETFADEGTEFLRVFDISTYDPQKSLQIGNATLTFVPTRHYIPTYAIRYKNDDTVITYSADTAPDDRVSKHAEGSKLFICEATLLSNEVEHGMRGHSSAREAADMARKAGAEHLMLTHYPSEATQEDLITHARGVFSGRITVADDHARVTV